MSSSEILLTVADIRTAEAALRKSAGTPLMLRAGEAVAKRVKAHPEKDVLILVLAGPGNNGGDAWVAAEMLRKAKRNVAVLGLGTPRWNEAVAQKSHDAYVAGGGKVLRALPREVDAALVVDGLFGIGITRAPSGAFADVIARVNQWHREGRATVIAIDIPSGLAADTGIAHTPTIEADVTMTFIAAKPGLFTADGPDHAGEVVVEPLGSDIAAGDGSVLAREEMAVLIPSRRANTHKGTYGSVAVLGGAEGMAGAAVLAARAALHMGPGKVFMGLFDNARPAFDPLNPEIMLRDARALARDADMDAFAIGMGAGETGAAAMLAVIGHGKPTVFDADALNALAANPSIRAAFQAKIAENAHQSSSFILTPHPGEAARLLGTSTAQVQADRVTAAKKLAADWSVVAVLKGAGTVVAHPDGRYTINTTGNPGMASGGMGDALSGMLGGLLAQGMSSWDAARLAVYLHGAAADAASHHGMGPMGLTASEVIFEARTLLNSGLDDGHD